MFAEIEKRGPEPSEPAGDVMNSVGRKIFADDKVIMKGLLEEKGEHLLFEFHRKQQGECGVQ